MAPNDALDSRQRLPEAAENRVSRDSEDWEMKKNSENSLMNSISF